ncbi:MAG: sensor histidine kinase [Brevundimonas sp.]|nr:sensor histidine kinase [Brevundimonas sp.]
MPSSQNDALDAVRAVHHQIGNSLQSVVSLLSLESRSAPPEAVGVLSEAGRRIRVVMRLHQRLQQGSGDEVRLDDLLGDVCRDVAELDAADRDAELRLDLHPCVAGSRTATPLAMITAELVGNALEHGLAGRAGVVRVSLLPGPDRALLIVSDDGLGSGDGEWKPGFGLTLVSRMAAQLDSGVVRQIGPGGSRYEIACPGVRPDPD